LKSTADHVDVDVNAQQGYDMSYIDINEELSRNIPSFEEWANNHGIQRVEGGFRLYPTNPNEQYDQNDVFVMTDVDIASGQGLMAVPGNMILTSTNSRLELESISESR